MLVSFDTIWNQLLPMLPPLRNDELAEVRGALTATLNAVGGLTKQVVELPSKSNEERLRAREGLYVGVGDPVRVALAIGTFALAMVLHPAFLVVITKGPGTVQRLLRFDSQLRPHLVTLWASLQGDEREVFEAVHKKQIETLITNYDAYAKRDFRRAFGHEPPTEDALVDALAGVLPPPRVLSALAELTSRGILTRSDQSYSIRV